jgi:L-glutamine synthetase (EC 6.3.1.2)
MSADVSKLLKKIEADKVQFIRLQFTDVPGMPKNAAIPGVQAEKALTEGIWFDGSSIEGFTRIEESDMLLKPDPASYAVLPWRPQEGKVARFMCDVYTYGAKPFEGDPRYVLEKAMATASKMGYTFNTGPELEFFLFNMVDGKPTTQFIDQGCYFDLAPQDKAEDVRPRYRARVKLDGIRDRDVPTTKLPRASTRSTSSTPMHSRPQTGS